MSMMDFQSALQGGAPPAGGGMPPPDMMGDGSDAGADTAAPETYTNSLEALDAAEEALKAFIELDPDHADKAVAAQCLQNVLKLKASNQDSAATGDLKSLQRALQGGAGANIGGAGGY